MNFLLFVIEVKSLLTVVLDLRLPLRENMTVQIVARMLDVEIVSRGPSYSYPTSIYNDTLVCDTLAIAAREPHCCPGDVFRLYQILHSLPL